MVYFVKKNFYSHKYLREGWTVNQREGRVQWYFEDTERCVFWWWYIEGCSGIITQKPQSQEVQFFLVGARLACEANAGILLIKGSVLKTFLADALVQANFISLLVPFRRYLSGNCSRIQNMANWTIHLSRLASGSLIPVDKILNMQFYNFEIHIYTRQSFATIALCIRTPYFLNSLWFIF